MLSEGVDELKKNLEFKDMKFENKTMKFYSLDQKESDDTTRLLHQTIAKVSNDLDNLRFNTAISQMMIFTNHLQEKETINKETLNTFLLLLNPFIPHMSEELNEQMDSF